MTSMEPVPWARTARVLAVASLPAAFLAQLVVPALLMAVCASVLALRGRRTALALPHRFGPQGLRQAGATLRLAMVGLGLSVLLWALYALRALP